MYSSLVKYGRRKHLSSVLKLALLTADEGTDTEKATKYFTYFTLGHLTFSHIKVETKLIILPKLVPFFDLRKLKSFCRDVKLVTFILFNCKALKLIE